MNWKIEYMYASYEDDIFLTKISQREKQSGHNADAVLNNFTDLESEST